MKKKKNILGLIMATSVFLLSGCGENQQIPNVPSTPNTSQKEDNNGEQYSIYLLAVNSGYNGTYEEWLESIRGDVIVLNLTESNILQWKYSLESDEKYRTLLDLSTLRGPKGDTGNGIKSIEKTSSDGLIDTYTITFTDGTTSTFNVTNASSSEDGIIKDISFNGSGERQDNIFDTVKNEFTSIRYTYNGEEFIPSSMKHEKYKSIMGNSYPILSEYFNWSTTKNMWIGSTKYEYSFDEKGRYTLSCRYSWSNDIDEWIYTEKTETTYDDENSIRVGISFSWDYENKKWVPTQKYERVQLTDDIYSEAEYRWSQETNEWAGYSKRESNENYGSTIASYSWSTTEKKWIGIGQKEMGYLDEETQQYIVDVYAWSSGLDDWLIKKKTIKHNSYETEEINYKWTDDQKSTINFQKKETVLDSSYEKPLSEITYVWSTEANDWLYSSKNEHEYCSYDNETYSASYYWSTSENKWIGLYKEEYEYNSKGRETMHYSYNWSTSENKWIGLHKEEREYNSNGRQTMYSSYNWSTETNDWVGTNKYTYVPDDLSYGWIEKISYDWSTETNDWVKDRKYEYKNGYQIAEYYWSTETNDWIQVDN